MVRNVVFVFVAFFSYDFIRWILIMMLMDQCVASATGN